MIGRSVAYHDIVLNACSEAEGIQLRQWVGQGVGACKCSVKLCLHDSRVEICVVLTRGRLESSAKSLTSRFPTIGIYFLEKDSAKYTTSLLKAG